MAFVLLANAAQEGNSTATTSAIDTTGADLIVCVIGYDLVGDVTADVTDSASNTWSVAGIGSTTTTRTASIFFCQAPTTSATHTFTMTGMFVSIAVLAFSGVCGRVDAITRNIGSSVTSLAPGSITPTLDGELLVTGLCLPTTATASIDAGFTISDQVGGTTGQFVGAAYLIQTSAAAANPSWSFSSNTGAAIMAGFTLATPATAAGGAWASA